MPSEKIKLRNTLEGSPQINSQLAQLEESIAPLKDCTVLLRDTFQVCSIHQQKVCEGTDTLSKLLSSFQGDALMDDDSFLSDAFSRLGRYLSELHSCQDMLSTQLQNAVVELLSQFISNDFSELDRLKENYDATWQEHEQATMRFSRISKKKGSEKTRFEANSDLFTVRKKHYESCLEYVSKLNGFKLKWKYSLLEPLLTFMYAQMAYFKVGHEVLSKDLGKVLNELNTEVQRVHVTHQQDIQSMTEEREELELSFPTRCVPDPDPTDPFIECHPPRTNITSKSGYLFLRVSKSGFSSQWDRGYFFTKKGCLYSHFPQKSPEMIVPMKGADVSVADIDDRRYVFQIVHSTLKRPLYLLAESAFERDEWMAVINNSGQSIQPQTSTNGASKDAEVIKIEIERIRTWVKKEIHEPAKRDKTKRAATSSSSGLSLPVSTSSQAPATIKSSPVFKRHANKQRKSETIQPQSSVSTPISPTSTPPLDQLPSPLQPEKIHAADSSVVAPLPQLQITSPPVAKKFSVKYLGHTEVQDGNYPNVIPETIRKVMTARSLQNVKNPTQIEVTISSKNIGFVNLKTREAIGQIQLKGILQYSTHPDNPKLLAIVNRTFSETEKPKFICHVMENDSDGTTICRLLDEAMELARKKSDQQPPTTVGQNRPASANATVGLLKTNGTSALPSKDVSGTDARASTYRRLEATQPNQQMPQAPLLSRMQSSGGNPFTKDQENASLTPIAGPPPRKSASASSLSTMNDFRLTPPIQPLLPGTSPASLSSSRSNSTDYLSIDAVSTIEKGSLYSMTYPTLTSVEDADSIEGTDFDGDYLPLPPLPCDLPPGPSSKFTDSSYVSDSLFEPSSHAVATPGLMNSKPSNSGYFPVPEVLFPVAQRDENTAFEDQSAGKWMSRPSQLDTHKKPSSMFDSSSKAFGNNNMNTVFAPATSTVDLGPVNSSGAPPVSVDLGYYAAQDTMTAPISATTSVPGGNTQPWTVFTPTSTVSSTHSFGSNMFGGVSADGVGDEFDLGEPVDLLGLSNSTYIDSTISSSTSHSPSAAPNSSFWPPDPVSSLANKHSSAAPNSSYWPPDPVSSLANKATPTLGSTVSQSGISSGYMMSSPVPHFSSTFPGSANALDDDDELDWLPSLSADDDILFAEPVVPSSSYGTSFVTNKAKK